MGDGAVLYSLFYMKYNQDLTQAEMLLLLRRSLLGNLGSFFQVFNAAKGFDTPQNFLQGQSLLSQGMSSQQLPLSCEQIFKAELSLIFFFPLIHLPDGFI